MNREHVLRLGFLSREVLRIYLCFVCLRGLCVYTVFVYANGAHAVDGTGAH